LKTVFQEAAPIIQVRFHFAPELTISITDEGIVEAVSAKTGAYLLIAPAIV